MSVKNVMKMNDQQTMNFIDYYEKEAVLWNTKLQAYRNKDARGEAVKRIVTAMNIEGFGPDHVLSKFKNLRSSYCQELKKIAASEKSGTSVEDIYVPHVVWFSKMDSFLKPFVTIRDTCSNYVILNENNSNDIENTDRKNHSMNELNESFQVQDSNEVEFKLIKPVPSTSANGNTNSTVIKKKEFKSLRKRDWNLKNKKLETSRSSCSEIETVLAAVKQLDSIAERAQKLSKKGDSFDQFGKYIASVLRDLPLKIACLLQQKMTNMVMNEIIENDNENVLHKQQTSSSTNTSDFGSPAMFDEVLSESPFTEVEDC